jgi:hypothetical protein
VTNILILGANGQVARYAINLFLNETDARLTLRLRNARRLRNVDPSRARIIEGDLRDPETRMVHQWGRNRIRDDSGGRSVQRERGVAQMRRSLGGEACPIAGTGGSSQLGGKQPRISALRAASAERTLSTRAERHVR